MEHINQYLIGWEAEVMQIENDIEKYLVRQVKRTGALCYKFT
ncbi:hypothetical protein HMPREF1334_02422, partial [Enterococcus faecalis ERV41]